MCNFLRQAMLPPQEQIALNPADPHYLDSQTSTCTRFATGRQGNSKSSSATPSFISQATAARESEPAVAEARCTLASLVQLKCLRAQAAASLPTASAATHEHPHEK